MATFGQSSTDHSGKVDIHKLARDGDKQGLEPVLRERRQGLEREIDEQDQRGFTPLQYAVIYNRPQVVSLLLDEPAGKDGKFANYMIIDEQGLSLAHHAAKTVRGKTRHAHSICIDGTSEHSDGYSSMSPHEQTSCLDLLIDKDERENGKTKVKLIYLKDKNQGQTVLHYAVMSGSKQSVESLIKADKNRDEQQLIHTTDKNGMTPLHMAATYNQRDIAEVLLINGADYLAQDSTESTALHYACSTGNLEMVILLLAKAETVQNSIKLLELKDTGGNTCLHIAAESGHSAVVQLLLDNDAPVPVPRRDGMCPLHVAVIGGKVGIVEAIMKKSSTTLSHKDSAHSTPLHLAAQYNRVKIATLLLDKRHSSVNDKDKDSNTPLHIAALHGNPSMARLLMQHGADIHAKNALGRIPLHGAAEKNRLEVVTELIRPENDNTGTSILKISDADRAGIKKELQELKNQFKTSEEQSDMKPARDIVRKYLVKHGLFVDDREPDRRIYNIVKYFEVGRRWKEGANTKKKSTEAVSDRNGRSVGNREREKEKEKEPEKEGKPRHPLVEREKTVVVRDHVDILLRQVYIANIVNTEDHSGNTALHLAAQNGHTDMVKCLLCDYLAEYDRKNDTESTALHLAAQNGHYSTVEVIVNKYPNSVFAEDQNCNTPIHLAAMNGHKDTMDKLVRKGADVNQINSNKMTALDLAAKFGKVDICDTLVQLEAQGLVKKTRTDVSPLHLACGNGHLEVVKLLLKSVEDFRSRNSDGLNCLDIAIDNGRRDVARYILQSSHWKVAMKNSVPRREGSKKIVTPMRRLIRNMPDVAMEVLDKCSEITNIEVESDFTKKQKKPTYRYNFEFVDDLMTEDGWCFTETKRAKYEKKGKKTQWRSYCKRANVIKKNHPLSIMVKHKREDLLQHHLVNQLIRTKWWTFGAYYYLITFLIHLLFLTLLTRYILQTRPPHLYNDTDAAKILADNCDSIPRDNLFNYWLPTEKFLMYFLMGIGAIFEIVQMINMRAAYLNSIESYVEWVVYILSFLFLLESNDCTIRTGYRQEWQWSLGAFAIFFVWIDLVLYLKAFTSLGLYVIMFEMVCWTFLKVFLVFFSLILAFALGFHTLVQNKIPFRDVANSILKTSVMFIGEIDYEALFNDGVETDSTTLLYAPATSVLFSIFITVACIVLMNLLVGLAVDDIKGILRKAAFKRAEMHIGMILDVEKVMFDSLRRNRYIKRDASQKDKMTKAKSKPFWPWYKLKSSKIWWWNQEIDRDETAVLLTIPERQERLEQSMESLKRQMSDLTKLLKPLIQDGIPALRPPVVPEKQNGGR